MKVCPNQRVESATVATGAIAIGMATGGSTDPAGALSGLAFDGGALSFGFALVYVWASCVGAAVAGIVFARVTGSASDKATSTTSKGGKAKAATKAASPPSKSPARASRSPGRAKK